MRLKASLLVLFLLGGCASTRTSELILGDASAVPARTPGADNTPLPAVAEESRAISDLSRAAPEPETRPLAVPASLALPAPQGDGLQGDRFTIKAGYFGSTEDAIDDGYIVNAAWTRFLSKIFAVELEIGYLDADGSDAGVDTDVWSIPVMLNARANLPVWILETYGGLGIGTFYYDAEADSGATSVDDDGFLWGGDAFLGASINIADALALGLEVKYYLSDEISDTDTGLDAYAVMLTLGFSR